MPKLTHTNGTTRTSILSSFFTEENAYKKLCMNCPNAKKCHAEHTYCKEYEEAVGRYKIGEPKYIRVKDRICKVDYKWFSREKPRYKCVDLLYSYEEDEILNKANTIEELCDEFVCLENKMTFHNLETITSSCNLKNLTIYGAIWTEWGLKYVAKMNEKGELELL